MAAVVVAPPRARGHQHGQVPRVHVLLVVVALLHHLAQLRAVGGKGARQSGERGEDW